MSIAIGTFAVFAASQIGTPGPANMALLATGARFGFRAALPFVAGVALGKQLIIWPIGFGLMGLADELPWLFDVLKYASAAYIMWLAWKVANMRLNPEQGVGTAPGFVAGLIVHPLNPKAWGMIVAGFTNFVPPGTASFNATATIAAVLLACQIVLHPVWTFGGDRIARAVAGTAVEPFLMWGLAALTVLSVLLVLFGGEPNMRHEAIVNQPTVATQRFDLRPVRISDQGLITLYGGDERVARQTTSIPHPLPPGAAREFIERAQKDEREEDVWVLDATKSGGSEMMGVVGLTRMDRGQSEIGYWIAPAFWNTGLAQEGVHALIEANPLENDAIFACVFQDNPASAKVLTNCGFEYLGDAESFSVARDAAVPTWTYIKKYQ